MMRTGSSARATRSDGPLARLCLLFALTAGCGGSQHSSPTAAPPGEDVPRQPPVSLTLERIDGTQLDIAQFRGKAVLLVGVTMDALNAQAILRNLEEVATRHPEDLAVVAIAGDQRPYREMHELLPVWAGVVGLRRVQLAIADDAIKEGASPLGTIVTVPTTFLVNRAGVLARRVTGYMTVPQIEALIAPALPGAAATPTARP